MRMFADESEIPLSLRSIGMTSRWAGASQTHGALAASAFVGGYCVSL